jgi:LAS superfamily LD-carboxypeptidase LdcB
MRHRNVFIFLAIVIIGAGFFFYSRQSSSKPATTTPSSKSSTAPSAATFDKSRYSIDQPGSLWWIVNKQRPLPAGYVPPNLIVPPVSLRLAATSEQMHVSNTIVPDLVKLFTAAQSAGQSLVLASGYRSVAYQQQLYDGYIKSSGQAAADRYSAKPGTSEHQTGLAFDVCAANTNCDLVQSFGDTPAGQWLALHAHEYGFIIRYAKDKEAITGYEYEPWHLRYVGTDLATELYTTQKTMEEFFGIAKSQ